MKSVIKFNLFMFVFLPFAMVATAPFAFMFWPISWLLVNEHGWQAAYLLPFGSWVWLVCAGIITGILSTQRPSILIYWVDWDRHAGAIFSGLLNWVFEPRTYKFGDHKNTVSAVLGANLHTKQAQWFDWLFSHLLDRSSLKDGKTHCLRAFEAEKRKGYGVFKSSL